MANPDFMNIKYDTLDQFATEIRQINQTGRQLMDDLAGQLMQHTAAWQGGAKDMYIDVKAKWDGQFDRMDQILGILTSHTVSTQEMYQEIEQKNMSLWGSR